MNTLLRLSGLTITLLAALAGAQDFSRKISYETSGSSAKKVVEDLAKLSEIQLASSPQTAGEVLVIKVKDVPLNKLMEQIAKVTSGSWVQEGDLYRLVADNAKRNGEIQTERSARTTAIREAIEKMVKPPETTPGTDANAAAMMAGMNWGSMGPVRTAILKILPSLDAATLADIGPDGRIVFSTTPTRMQRPIGRNLTPIITELVREHNKSVEAMRRVEDQTEKTEQQKQIEEFTKLFGMTETKPIEGVPTKALMIVSRQQFFDGLTIQFRMYDNQGKVLLNGTQNITLEMPDFAGFMPTTSTTKPAPAEKDTEIKFSTRTLELLDFFRGMNPMGGGAAAKPFPKALQDVMLRPDLNDPLSMIHGEATVAVANAKGLNLVANLPDSLISFFGMLAPQKMMVNAYAKDLASGKNTVSEEKDGWLTVWPAKPADSRKHRSDRVALTQFIGIAHTKGVPSLDEFAAFALKSEPPMSSPASMTYLMLFAPNTMNQGMGGLQNWEMLRFYGTLSQGQKMSLLDGAPIRFGMLSVQQRDILTRMIYGASGRLRVGDTPKKEDGGFMDMIANFMPAKSNDYRDEPTEVMPNGLPGDGYITLAADTGHFAMAANVEGNTPASMFGALGPDEIAMLRYIKEDPNMSAFTGALPAIEKFKLGQRETFNFTFHLAPSVVVNETLKNDRMEKNASTVAFDNLPSEFRERIEKRLAAFKKNPMSFPGMGGFGAPPP